MTMKLLQCHLVASSIGCYCFISISMALLLTSLSLANADVVCPPEAAYAPCGCSEYSEKPDTIYLNCYNRNLGDSKMSDILDAFLTTPGISPVGLLDLMSNRLTRVPTQMKFFNQLDYVYLNNNDITSIESGAFNFPDAANPILDLDLQNNQLTTIAPGAFKGNGYGNGTNIILEHNKLTRFEATVFQTVLEKIGANFSGAYPNAYVDIRYDPIDCSDCHLAWLIRDNRHLLPLLRDQGACANGTSFNSLNPYGLADCPSFVCPLDYDGSYADPLNCASFYFCTSNVAVLNDCPNDEVFNPETGRCDVAANVPISCPSSAAAKMRLNSIATTFGLFLFTFIAVSLQMD